MTTDAFYDTLFVMMLPGVGPAKTEKLRALYGSLGEVKRLTSRRLDDCRILGEEAREAIRSGEAARAADRSAGLIERENLSVCLKGDPNYPVRLLEMENPPEMLFFRGRMKADEKCVCVIGTRACTNYGRQVAMEIGRRCAEQGLSTVSGLAEGIDGVVHGSTSEAGGRTVAVLAGNPENPYPESNRRLIGPIVKNGGCVLSEVPPGKKISRGDFIVRNRIIAGLGTVMIIVEAGEKSGCFSALDYMNSVGRDIYAVPGNITSARSLGTNKMLQQGARVYTSFDDFLVDSGLGTVTLSRERFTSSGIEMTNMDRQVLAGLAGEPRTLEQLSEEMMIDPDSVSQSLTFLTLYGEAVEISPGRFVKKQRSEC